MRRLPVLGLVVLTVALSGCAGHLLYPSGPFQGQVVDAETKQPLAGAAVVLVWYSEAPGLGHSTDRVHDVTEVVTDQNGEFTVPRRTHVVVSGQVNPPYVIVYYPGYKDFLGGQGFEARGHAPTARKVVELIRAPESERRLFAGFPDLTGSLPPEKVPNLRRLIDQERRALGLGR